MVAAKVDAMIVSELDEIAWLFNLRGEGKGRRKFWVVRPTIKTFNLCLLSCLSIIKDRLSS